jgi:SAM-dependent methyltransferase
MTTKMDMINQNWIFRKLKKLIHNKIRIGSRHVSFSGIIVKINYLLYRNILSFPTIVECNVCGWEGKHFGDTRWHKLTMCWNCMSEVRHRLIVETFSRIELLSFEKLVEGKDVLHFAPERSVGQLLKKRAHKYVTADINPKGVDLKIDISDMVGIKSDEFDLILVCEILEHVNNDKRALEEIHRVLRPGGYAILTVPQDDNFEDTYEDPSITTDTGRECAFGQPDHLRVYGKNFQNLLENVGFQVTVINEKDFSEEIVKKHVLIPPIFSDNPFARCVSRKVFFARKMLLDNKIAL